MDTVDKCTGAQGNISELQFLSQSLLNAKFAFSDEKNVSTPTKYGIYILLEIYRIENMDRFCIKLVFDILVLQTKETLSLKISFYFMTKCPCPIPFCLENILRGIFAVTTTEYTIQD